MTTVPTSGQKPHVIAAAKVIAAKWPKIPVIGGYRPGDPQDHGKGLALDIMVNMLGKRASGDSLTMGNEIAAWAQGNARQLNVQYIIWQGKIWNISRASEGWRRDHNASAGATLGHYDHVHISFKPTGGSISGLDDTPSGTDASTSGGDNGMGAVLSLFTSLQTWWRVLWAVLGFALVIYSLLRMTGTV